MSTVFNFADVDRLFANDDYQNALGLNEKPSAGVNNSSLGREEPTARCKNQLARAQHVLKVSMHRSFGLDVWRGVDL